MVTIHIQPATEARLEQLARTCGQDLSSYVTQLVEQVAGQNDNDMVRTGTELDRVLDELFAADTRPLPATQLTYSRQDIYFDHD
jgi:hypothetical protein